MSPLRAVLFDLDGTLVDSAPDLAGAGNDMRAARGLAPYPLAHYRPMVGSGARGMVGRAFAVTPDDASFAELRDEFLRCYEERMTRETRVFPEMRPVLEALQAAGRPWGIVTNKATRFGDPLVRALGLLPPAATLVCGDTTAHSKPHPAPLLEAARRMGMAPGDCVYVGDDLRDVQAGHAAGMQTIAAAWGYLGAGDPVQAWGAHHVAQTPADLLKLLRMD
ncbi:MAG: phosphoglycolate phosphatase [Pseudomonadota bacterium]|nr:phosphoglycolate phosphatase [Pseudomonadota bacterium]